MKVRSFHAHIVDPHSLRKEAFRNTYNQFMKAEVQKLIISIHNKNEGQQPMAAKSNVVSQSNQYNSRVYPLPSLHLAQVLSLPRAPLHFTLWPNPDCNQHTGRYLAKFAAEGSFCSSIWPDNCRSAGWQTAVCFLITRPLWRLAWAGDPGPATRRLGNIESDLRPEADM